MATRPLIRAILIDLSGTLHIGSSPTPNAVAALKRLRSANIPFRFCSNTSKESTADLCKRLRRVGFDVSSNGGAQQEIWTSLAAVQRLVHDRGLKRPFLLLSESAKEEFKTTEANDSTSSLPFDSVIVGLAPSAFTYENLNTAFRILIGEHEGQGRHREQSSHPKRTPPLIATHKAKFVGAPDGALSLGPGPFVAALENASGVSAEVVGKPTTSFFEAVLRSFELDEGGEGRIAVVGDDVEADLGGGAVELGLWRVLVKTGKYRPGDEHRSGTTPPNETAESFADWIDDLLSSQTSLPS